MKEDKKHLVLFLIRTERRAGITRIVNCMREYLAERKQKVTVREMVLS